MKEIIDWLMRDEQKVLFEIVFAFAVNLVFLALAGLLLWPLGRGALVVGLAKGYLVFWLTVRALVGLLFLLQRRFRVNLYDHSDAFIVSNIATSGLLTAGWSAFAALSVRAAAAGASGWVDAAIYSVGVLSCLAATYPVGAYFQGALYRLGNIIVAPAGFALFAAWPAAARAAFGWYFDFFRE